MKAYGFIATNPTTWTHPGIVERLRELRTVERRSAGSIARILSNDFALEISRSAVLGKLKRLGLLKRSSAHVQPRPALRARDAVTPRDLRMVAAVEHGVDYSLIAERFGTTIGNAMNIVCRVRKQLRAGCHVEPTALSKARAA